MRGVTTDSGTIRCLGRLRERVIEWENRAWAFTQAMKLVTILFTDFGTFYLQTTSAVTVAIVFE